MVKYVFRDPLVLKGSANADPQAIGKELERLKDPDGNIYCKKIITAAREPSHLFHPHFTWDVQRAAEERWMDQARILIRAIHIEDDRTEDGTAPAFVSINGEAGTRYWAIKDVVKSKDLIDLVLKAAHRDLEAFEKRYRTLTDVCAVVGRAKTIVKRKLARKESRPSA